MTIIPDKLATANKRSYCTAPFFTVETQKATQELILTEVNFALLAEHVSESCDGKLSVVGVFDQIWATSASLAQARSFPRTLARS